MNKKLSTRGRKRQQGDKRGEFERIAAELGADESGAEFKRVFRKIVPPRVGKPKPQKSKA